VHAHRLIGPPHTPRNKVADPNRPRRSGPSTCRRSGRDRRPPPGRRQGCRGGREAANHSRSGSEPAPGPESATPAHPQQTPCRSECGRIPGASNPLNGGAVPAPGPGPGRAGLDEPDSSSPRLETPKCRTRRSHISCTAAKFRAAPRSASAVTRQQPVEFSAAAWSLADPAIRTASDEPSIVPTLPVHQPHQPPLPREPRLAHGPVHPHRAPGPGRRCRIENT
jgi:hypothetical protein